MNTKKKYFSLLNQSAQCLQTLKMESSELLPCHNAIINLVRHHIIIIDQSEYMERYALKVGHFLTKLLTLEEYHEQTTQVSLVFFDETKSLYSPVQRSSISEFLSFDSKLLDIISRTGIKTPLLSQLSSSTVVEDLISPDEFTIISLNTREPLDTHLNGGLQRISVLLEQIKQNNLVINCLSYGQESTLTALKKIASRGHGIAIRAEGLRHTYDSIFNSISDRATLTNACAQIKVSPLESWVFVNPATGNVISGQSDITVSSISKSQPSRLYKIRKLNRLQELATPPLTQASTPEESLCYLALAYWYIVSEKKFNYAKYALLASNDTELIAQHTKALTKTDIQLWCIAIKEKLVLGHISLPQEINRPILNAVFPSVSPLIPTIQDLFELLKKHRSSIQISKSHLTNNYQNRGFQHISKSESLNHQQHRPNFEYRPKTPHHDYQLHDIKIAHYGATINIITREAVSLYRAKGIQVTEMEGVNLEKLAMFRTYTMVADGLVHHPILMIKIQSKRLHHTLKQQGFIEEDYSPNQVTALNLSKLRIINPPIKQPSASQRFEAIIYLKFMVSFLNVHLGSYSDQLTQEQISLLRTFYITPNLSVNVPSSHLNPNLSQAIDRGLIHQRNSTRMELGSYDFGLMSKLPSAMRFIKDTYRVLEHGKWRKPNSLDDFSTLDFKVASRLKPTSLRALLRPLSDDILNIGEGAALRSILRRYAPNIDAELIIQILQSEHTDQGLWQEPLRQLREVFKRSLRNIYDEWLSPTMLYIGSSGLLPDTWDGVISELDTLTTQPDLENSSRILRDQLTLQIDKQMFIKIMIETKYYPTKSMSA
jgi:hypothetical protein